MQFGDRGSVCARSLCFLFCQGRPGQIQFQVISISCYDEGDTHSVAKQTLTPQRTYTKQRASPDAYRGFNTHTTIPFSIPSSLRPPFSCIRGCRISHFPLAATPDTGERRPQRRRDRKGNGSVRIETAVSIGTGSLLRVGSLRC